MRSEAEDEVPIILGREKGLAIMKNLTIEKVIGREIMDSRGNPTVEAEVYLARRYDRKRDCTKRCIHRRV